jgi:hypothetical protein
MVCVPPKVKQACDLGTADSTIFVVMLAGIVCLLFAGVWIVFFDISLLPMQIKRLAKNWSSDCTSSRACLPGQHSAIVAVPAVSEPKPPCFSPAKGSPEPPDEPPPHATEADDTNVTIESERMSQDLRLAANVLGDCPSSAEDSLPSCMIASNCSDMSTNSDVNTDRSGDASGSVSTVDSVAGAAESSQQFEPRKRSDRSSTLRWPHRLARIWALRVIFLRTAAFAVCARIFYPAACALITWHLSANDIAAFFMSFLFGVLPLVWCAIITRPPSAGPAAGVPDGVKRCCCWKVPGLNLFAVATAVLEIYGTVSAAASVLRVSPCEQPLWQTALLHCSGLFIMALRLYTAVLAIRLQEQFTSCVRKVLPVASKLPSPLDTNDIMCDISLDVEFDAAPPVSIQKGSPVSLQSLRVQSPDSSKALSILADHVRRNKAPPSNAKAPSKNRLCNWCQSKRRLRSDESRCSVLRRWLLRSALVLAVVVAVASIWVVYAYKKEDAEEELPSSCAPAQNATTTCSPFESIGEHYWDKSQGASPAAVADTMEACCQGCDEIEGCQAWLFEHLARKCMWIRFTESPCKDNPGDLECRCLTHYGSAFGFKPTAKLVWTGRSGTK